MDAYCLDFDKGNPSKQNEFSLGDINSEIKKIFESADELTAAGSVAAIQIAVWVLTDDILQEELKERLDIDEEDIQNARFLLEKAGMDVSYKRLFSSSL